jgi:chromosome segregation ATPase
MTDPSTPATLGDLTEAKTELRGEIRALGVIVEHLSSKIDTLSEGFGGLREQITTEIGGLERRLGDRITLLEEVVRKNSEDIRKNSEDIHKNSEDIQRLSADVRASGREVAELRAEVADLRARFDRREDMRELNERVAAIEKKLGIR